MANEKIGSLEEEALKRKERLAALKQKTQESNQNNQQQNDTLPKPKFRSYKPQDESLKENILDEAKPGDIISEVQEQLDASKTKFTVEELEIGNLAPRKPDWDLKRNVAKKLEKLERRTQKSIAELIRKRLEPNQDDLPQITE
ncbi:hypothetical protein HCN44_006134 [Aphidius gifuensis]|uniref:Coiled-coil domain-containing protein 12 n=1 Tax=Aphidius gifuensis TaxID=684658 RepID=A0A835CXL4_APHGI|nr:coiled-coil domain-containing protein 12 [Aphidius gifuensis]KAF7997563.1 hypothetical protein HCN44_006134 [Aphidius gifuensis]